jgi:DNA primase
VIRDDVVERVREEADIVSIVGDYVKLKRVGNSFRGPCPFHGGKDNNFSVTMKGGYKCFVCQESGDVFTFVQKHLGLDFVEAVKLVGAKAGVDVPEVARRPDDERDRREPLWEVNATAADFFRSQLWDSPSAKHVRSTSTRAACPGTTRTASALGTPRRISRRCAMPCALWDSMTRASWRPA